MEYIIITILLSAAIFFAAKYFILKKQINSVSNQLDDKSIHLVTIELMDDSLEEMVQKINLLLEDVQQTIIKENLSSDALKSSIANISHDMKTPLTSVIGYLQLAEKDCPDEPTKNMIKICLERTKYCNALINDFFELSFIESQGCSPNLEIVDAAEELCEQILANSPLFDEKGITPYFDNSDKSVLVSADKIMLRRILQNLISNSIQYTCGDIYFDITTGDFSVITISNSVSSEIDTEHIFDRFYVQDKSRHTGHGIGLYLCKKLVESMGGNIYAEMNDNNLNVYLELNTDKNTL